MEGFEGILNETGNNLSHFGNFSDGFFPLEDAKFHAVMYFLNTYVTPVVIFIGVLGNSLSFVVFVGTHLSRQSSSIYLAVLAAVDNVFLLTLLFVWFGLVEIHIFKRNGWCQSISYCTYVCSFLSVWTVVSFTAERYIVVFHPIKRHRLCTRRRAAGVMASLTVAGLGFYMFTIFTQEIQYYNDLPVCMQSPKYHNIVRIMATVDTFITLIIPTVAIVTMNTAIGIRVYNYTRRTLRHDVNACMSDYYNSSSIGSDRPSHSREWAVNIKLNEHSNGLRQSTTCRTYREPSESGTASRAVKPRQWRAYTRRHVSQMRVTRALLIVSTVYLLLNLPSYALRVHAFFISLANKKLSLAVYTWQSFLQFLYYFSFSANFFLYVACSRNFRSALKRLFRRTAYNIREMNVLQYFKIRCWWKKPEGPRF